MTTEQKWTPGPWRISQNVSRHVIAPKGGVVACAELTWDGPGSNDIANANARLIAAAPAMYEALKAFVNAEERFKRDTGLDYDDLINDALELARAALKEPHQ